MLAHRDALTPHRGRRRVDVRPVLALAVIGAGLVGAALTGHGLSTTPAVVSAAPEPPTPLTGPVKDTGDPTLQDLRYSPGSVNVMARSRNVTFTVTAKDTGGHGPASGISYGFVSLSSPDFARSAYTALEKSSAGTWVGTVAIPRWTHGGVWTVNTLGLGDEDGNYEYWSASELTRLGFPTTLTVGAHPDDAAPELTHFRVSRRSVEAGTGARTVTVIVTAKDSRSGIRSIVASASQPGSRHRSSTALAKVRGTASTYRGTLVLPWRQANGTWHVDSVRLDDTIGNATITSHAQLRAAGFHRTFRVDRRSPHPGENQPDVRTADRFVNPFDREQAHLSVFSE